MTLRTMGAWGRPSPHRGERAALAPLWLTHHLQKVLSAPTTTAASSQEPRRSRFTGPGVLVPLSP